MSCHNQDKYASFVCHLVKAKIWLQKNNRLIWLLMHKLTKICIFKDQVCAFMWSETPFMLSIKKTRLFIYRYIENFTTKKKKGWSGGAKVLCILHHWGVQLILAYSWARPAILVVGKGRGGMFLFLLFLHFHSCSSFFPVPLFHLLYSFLPLFSLSLGDDTKWPSRVDVSLNPNTINQITTKNWKFSDKNSRQF